MNYKQQMIADGAPRALFMTAEQRRKAWVGRPLTVVSFVKLQRDESAEMKAMREQLKRDEIAALKNRVARAKLRKETKAIDFNKVRWDARRNKFVPLTGDKPVTESAPVVKAPSIARSEPVVTRASTGAGTEPRVTKDNAEAVAKLNSVWKPEYEKLRGTGRIVMTVGNMLRGLVKRGGTVKWQ